MSCQCQYRCIGTSCCRPRGQGRVGCDTWWTLMDGVPPGPGSCEPSCEQCCADASCVEYLSPGPLCNWLWRVVYCFIGCYQCRILYCHLLDIVQCTQ